MATLHSPNRPPTRAICTRAPLALLALCVTCSVYDDTLLAVGQAGSAGSMDTASGSGGSGSTAGSTPAPQGGMGSAGMTSTGKGGSGGGGSTGTGKGGSAGTAGSTMAGAAGDDNAAGGGPTYELIDDMEDNDRFVSTGTDRDGYWQTHNDMTVGSTQFPLPGGSYAVTDLAAAGAEREGSMYAAGMHVTGFVGSVWGALMVVSMHFSGASIDGSAFCGIHFWAKRTGTGELVVKVVDKHSSPMGGLCIDSDDAGDQRCYDDFHTTVPVTTEWSDYMVRFSDLMQYGDGYQSPTGLMDNATIHGIVFAVDETADFEILVDDLEFVFNGHCAP